LTVTEYAFSARSAEVFVHGDVATLRLMHLHDVAVANAAVWSLYQWEPVSEVNF
jgi:hypothetical protein